MPVSPPLTVKESDDSVSVRPTNVLSFNAGDFTVAGSGDTATISIDSTGTGASLTDTYVGFGNASDLLTGSANFTFTEDTGSGPILLLTGENPRFNIQDDTTGGSAPYYTQISQSGASLYFVAKDDGGTNNEIMRMANTYLAIQRNMTANVGIGTVPDSGIVLDIKGTPDQVLRLTDTTDNYALTLSAASSGSFIEFGDMDDSADSWMSFGAYSGTNNVDSKGRDLVILNTNKEMMRFTTGNDVVVNNDSDAAVDFWIKGDNDNILYADASQDNLGLGTSAPASDVERVHIKGTGVGTDIVRIQTDDDGAASGPHIQIYRDSATPADGDDLGEFFFAGNHAASSGAAEAGKENYARIRSEAVNVVTGAEEGRILFDVVTGGTLTDMLQLRGDVPEVVVNEGSGDVNFRAESNGNTHMLFVDAGVNMVSVGGGPTSGGAIFQVRNGTISHYENVRAVRSDATAQMNFADADCQNQLWVNNTSTAWTLVLPEGGIKGQTFRFVSTDGDMDVDPQGTDTLNGGTGTLSRNTNNEIYTVVAIATGTWILSNPN